MARARTAVWLALFAPWLVACDIVTALGGGSGLRCERPEACPAGHACIEGSCRPLAACRTDQECFNGQRCDPVIQRCVAIGDAGAADRAVSDSGTATDGGGAADSRTTDGSAGDAAAGDAVAGDRTVADGWAADQAPLEASISDGGGSEQPFDGASPDRIPVLCGNGRLDPDEVCDSDPGCDWNCRGCAGGVDHGGADIAIDLATGWSGLHCNIGTLTVGSSGVLQVMPFDGAAHGELRVAAQSIVVHGAIDATGAGYGGGGGGAGSLYGDAHYCWCGPGCSGGTVGGPLAGEMGARGVAIAEVVSSSNDCWNALDYPEGYCGSACCATSAAGRGGGLDGRAGARGWAYSQVSAGDGVAFAIDVAVVGGGICSLLTDRCQQSPLSQVLGLARTDPTFAVAVGPEGVAIADRGSWALAQSAELVWLHPVSVTASDPYDIYLGVPDGVVHWQRGGSATTTHHELDTPGETPQVLQRVEGRLVALTQRALYARAGSNTLGTAIAGPASVCSRCLANPTSGHVYCLAAAVSTANKLARLVVRDDDQIAALAEVALPGLASGSARSCAIRYLATGSDHFAIDVGSASGGVSSFDIGTGAAQQAPALVASFEGSGHRPLDAAVAAIINDIEPERYFVIGSDGSAVRWTERNSGAVTAVLTSTAAFAAIAVLDDPGRGGRGGGPWGGTGGARGLRNHPVGCTTDCVADPGLPGQPGGYAGAAGNGDLSASGLIARGSGGGGGGGGDGSMGYCTGSGAGGAGGVAGRSGASGCASGSSGSGGGAGGGAITLHASQSIAVAATGSIRANGSGDAALGAGYGAGGGIELHAPRIDLVAGARLTSLGGASAGAGTVSNGGTIVLRASVVNGGGAGAVAAGRIVSE